MKKQGMTGEEVTGMIDGLQDKMDNIEALMKVDKER